MIQCYLTAANGFSVRVRMIPDDDVYQLTVKGPREGISREEEECTIPRMVAEALVAASSGAKVEKTRFPVLGPDGRMWTVDVFHGVNRGLVLAEVELPEADDSFVKPAWCGEEVTDDLRYYNEYLSITPYAEWR